MLGFTKKEIIGFTVTMIILVTLLHLAGCSIISIG